MSKNDKNDKINNLQQEFNKIQEDNKDLDVNMYLAKTDDLPEFGEIEIYDYNADVVESKDRADEVLNSLVDLYLGDLPSIKAHSYIKNKVKEDALNYAETLFLIKMTRKTFISQMRQVDNGDNSARMHEVVNQTIAQVRENSKFLSGQRTELEKFYKTLRKDMGHDEIEAPKEILQDDETTDDGFGGIMDNRQLNDLIKKAMMGKEDGKK